MVWPRRWPCWRPALVQAIRCMPNGRRLKNLRIGIEKLPKLILKKRWPFVANELFGVSSILNPIRPRRGWLWITQKMCCWFISVQDRTPSVSSGRGLWSSPRNVKPFTLGFALWTNGVRPEWPRWIKRLQRWNSIPISKPILFFALTDPIWCGVSVIIVVHGCGSWPSVTGCNWTGWRISRSPPAISVSKR